MLTLGAAKPKVEPLCAAIPNRSTNRKPYTGAPLSPAHTAALLESIQGDRDVSLTLLEEKEKVQTFAKVVSLNEQLLMENRPLHDFLFSMIRWSPEEEAMTPGLYIKTMELPPPVRFLFKRVLFRWSWVLFLNRIGFSRMISKQTAALYSTSSAFGVITIPSLEDKNFLQAGRALQKIWLTATNLGLSLQPVTALPYLSQRVQAGEALAFSDEHQQLIIEADGQIRQLAAIPKVATIAMVFRIGYAPSPSASSAKRKPIFR